MTSSSQRTALVVNGIFSITFLILAVLITIYHLISTYKSTGHLCNKAFLLRSPAIVLSYVLIFVSCISGLSFTSDTLFTTELCAGAQFYGPSLYSIFKTIIYLILCFRIYISFKESIYSYNTKRLMAWAILLCIWTLFNVIAGNLTVTSSVETEEGNTKCLVNPSIIYIISQALLDVTSGVINCYLFVRPICKLYNLAQGNVKIKRIAYKQCILSLIAIMSSILAMAGVANAPSYVPVFVSLDMLLSTLCVVLMYKWNSYITETIFCCCMPKDVAETEIGLDGKAKVASKTGISDEQISANSDETTQNKTHTVAGSNTLQTATLATNRLSQPTLAQPSTVREETETTADDQTITITVMDTDK